MSRMAKKLRSRRWLVSGLVPILALLVLGGGVLAGGWCRADPIVELEGEEVQIWVAIPEEYQSQVNGPIDVTIAVPDDVDTEVKFLDAGFNGHGETVTFVEGGKGDEDEFAALITVSVPMEGQGPSSLAAQASSVPVQVEVVYDGESRFFMGTNVQTNAHVIVDPDD